MSRSRVVSKSSTAQGPASVQTTLVSSPKMPSRLIDCGATSRWLSRCSRSQTSCVSPWAVPEGPRRPCAPRAAARRGPSSTPSSLARSSGAPRAPRRGRRAGARGTRRRARRPRPRVPRTSPGRSPRPRSERRRVGSRDPRYRVARRPIGEHGWLDGDMAAPPSTCSMDAVSLTEDLVDIESVSGNEQQIADAVEAALRGLAHLEVQRFGHTSWRAPTRAATSGWCRRAHRHRAAQRQPARAA